MVKFIETRKQADIFTINNTYLYLMINISTLTHWELVHMKIMMTIIMGI